MSERKSSKWVVALPAVAACVCLFAVYANANAGRPMAATILAACVGLNVHSFMRLP